MTTDSSISKLRGDVQVDETFVGASRRSKNADGTPRKRGRGTTKTPVMALVETGGEARTQVMPSFGMEDVRKIITDNVDKSARIITDEMGSYPSAAFGYEGGHARVNHRSGQYVNADGFTTNTAESFFSLLKRGHYGVYHKMSKKHLHRYCDEFAFRWNRRKLTDSERRTAALQQIDGKRLFFYPPQGSQGLV